MEKEFAIVKFSEENDSLGIIPLKWVYDNGKLCDYPKVYSDATRDQLVKKKVIPQKNWLTCSIEILHEYETYSDARLHLRKAEETSNLETDDDELRRPRKRIRRVINLPGESDEESNSDNRTIDEGNTLISHLSKKLNKEVSYPVPPTTRSKHQNSFILNDIQDAVEEHLPQSSSSDLLHTVNKVLLKQGHIMSTLADIISFQTRLDKKMDGVIGKLSSFTTTTNSLDCVDEYFRNSLPLDSDEKFTELNNKLKDNLHDRKHLTNFLSLIGGKDVRSLINSMLHRLMLDKVAELFSLTGKQTKVSQKKAFISTEVYQIILDVCRKFFPDTTDKNFREICSDWLNQAKVRRSRRAQKLITNEDEETS